MDRIEWNKDHYRINGKDSFLLSGEFHYFRVPKEQWLKRIELAKKAGLNCIATYIPWMLHEPREGEFDFSTRPHLMFESFLQLCKEMDVLAVCRPGPYQYSELKYAGLPEWLINNYPEIGARTIDGVQLGRSSLSYLHPTFLEKVKAWYDTVCPIIAKYTVQNGGPVAFVQIDNELMGVHDWAGSWDYNKETMGIGQEDGRYGRFLRKRYGDIAAVSHAYGIKYDSLAQVLPLKPIDAQTYNDLRRVKDYQDFYFATISEYVVTLAGWMRQNGITCDLIHNSGSPYMNGFFMETVEEMKNGFILGGDHYYCLDMDWDQNNPTPKYATKVYVSNEMLKSMGMPATVYEMPAGSGSDWPPITASDLECCYMVNTALGMKGINYYIFTGGPNPPKGGNTTDIYDYGAPVSAEGEVRESYYVLKKFHEFLNNNAWLAKATIAADINIAMDFDQSRCQFEKNAAVTKGISGLEVWAFLRKGFMITALCNSYTPSLICIEDSKMLDEIDKPLLVPASFCMSQKAQQNVIAFIKNGGHVLIAPCIPELDENYHPCTLLKDFLQCGTITRYNEIEDSALRLNVGSISNVCIKGKLFKTDSVPEGASVFATEETYGGTVGWTKRYGKGMIMWLGFCWKHSQKEHGRMLEHILKYLGVHERQVVCDNPNIWAVKRTDGENNMLFIMNLFTSESSAGIKVKNNGIYSDLGTVSVPGISVKKVVI